MERSPLGDRSELFLQSGHDSFHVQRFTMTFFPGFQTREKGTVVWLVGIGNNSIAADRLVRLDPFSFC